MMLTIIFWVLLFILFYTYLGYGLILWLLVKLKQAVAPAKENLYSASSEPEVCLFVPAYNEKDYIEQKVANSFALNYPKGKIQYLWVSDGSDDGTNEKLKKYSGIDVEYLPERKGKVNAINHGMRLAKGDIIIFSDCNTILGPDTVKEIVQKFHSPKVGCVAGEKRIVQEADNTAASSGEGLYWHIESWMKKMDSDFNSVIGADGGVFAIRKELFQELEPDIVLDDFIISLRIAMQGYTIAYAPGAYAEETASLNVREELKRKIRIAAGGVQTIFRLRGLMNPFRYGILSWQYFSHKVLRWTLTPIALFLLPFVNLLLVMQHNTWCPSNFYALVFWLQLVCYGIAVFGWYFEQKRIRLKMLFAPYYFVMINYAGIRGMLRYLKGRQPVNWEKSKRA
ncbi:glycosyltransferase family 2 protein [Maribellus sp. YY47]|uniref:glycosyltransferase family 2 protein n=1 Tax=Maribellus sp. YY47 TaxID=2929486 RepID=UPI002001060D|nr:glycosyltransferase family 2 protein [Maribellus sp. YY47]MCK3682786.1 glycosyltransferase family 2 protein [Maribellus sp. YY47]